MKRNRNKRGNKLELDRWTIALATAGLVSLSTVAWADDGTNAPPAGTNAPPAQPYGKKAKEGFLKRLNEAYGEQFATPAYSPPDTNAPPAPVRRIGPPPFDSPPFPTGDWQLGGGPNVIGDPGALRDSPWPLMQAIYDGPHGEWWYNSRIQLYGWVTVSGNLSTSRNTGPSQVANFPTVYDERPNRVENEQDVLYIERMADQNQMDHIDWGFRAALLYGLDYRFMASKGYINDHNLFYANKFNGFDTPMLYANLYVPDVAQGMSIIVGRIISMPDIEQQLAPNNLMMSHSLVYSFDNYTMWGIWTSTKLNKNWVLQLGLADGVDIAPFGPGDPGRQPTGSINLQYISSGGHDSFYVGMNSFNNGDFGFNNLQECIESYTHKFNDTWWTTFEGQYMYTRNAVTAPTTRVPYVDAFYPTKAGYVWTAGLLNYTMCRIAPNAFLTIRNEFWDDPDGYRSGYSSSYYEGSVGINWWPTKLICVRPEIRFDHSFRAHGLASTSAAFNTTGAPVMANGAYDNGTRQNQAILGLDITYHF
ncbi:MAG TPA: outer membrane beta-barrel protein [Verrucomicrobiae bacterium]|nr:outer membrane beta-barrel protein [Verrucomicrobiae bacterium]